VNRTEDTLVESQEPTAAPTSSPTESPTFEPTAVSTFILPRSRLLYPLPWHLKHVTGPDCGAHRRAYVLAHIRAHGGECVISKATWRPNLRPSSRTLQYPTAAPTEEPTATPTDSPTASPTSSPTLDPTAYPTAAPTAVSAETCISSRTSLTH
jgi:hypothetical protein